MVLSIDKRFVFGSLDYQLDHGKFAGYFARGYRAFDPNLDKTVVIKLLRHEVDDPSPNSKSPINRIQPGKFHYDAFNKEALILELLDDKLRDEKSVARVPKLHYFGYINGLNKDIPKDGVLEEISTVSEFTSESTDRMKSGWRPYLVVEYFPLEKNVRNIMEFYNSLETDLDIFKVRNNHVRAHYPLFQLLLFCYHVAKLFRIIHNNDSSDGPIVYPDCRLDHFFHNGRDAVVIDWNRAFFLNSEIESEVGTPVLSPKQDIINFLTAPVFALLTGEDPGSQPFFNKQKKEKHLGGYVSALSKYPEEIQQLFHDALINGTVNKAIILESRCEEILNSLFGYSLKQEKMNGIAQILHSVFTDAETVSSIVAKMDASLANLYFDDIPDSQYLGELIDYLRARRIHPWQRSDPYSDF